MTGACPSGMALVLFERRLAAIGWNCAQRGMPLDRKNRAIATVMAGIRNTHAAPPRQKEAILPEDLIAMLETLDRGTLRGLRDRAMLLVGFAGGLRRSEITGLDLGRDQTDDGRGWIEIFDKGALLTLRGKTGWREIGEEHGAIGPLSGPWGQEEDQGEKQDRRPGEAAEDQAPHEALAEGQPQSQVESARRDRGQPAPAGEDPVQPVLSGQGDGPLLGRERGLDQRVRRPAVGIRDGHRLRHHAPAGEGAAGYDPATLLQAHNRRQD